MTLDWWLKCALIPIQDFELGNALTKKLSPRFALTKKLSPKFALTKKLMSIKYTDKEAYQPFYEEKRNQIFLKHN